MYAEYVEAQLARQEERRKSLEARGVAVITSSGTLATLLLGLVAIATREETTFDLPTRARLALACAVIAFAAAAALSIVTTIPRKGEEALVSGLRRFIAERRGDSEEIAVYKVAQNRLDVLESARELDSSKAKALVAAVGCETIALVALAWAMIEILI